MQIKPERLRARMQEMARVGGTERGGVSRLALTDADRDARNLFAGMCQAVGMTVRVDDVGNMYARHPGTDQAAAPVLVGSHLDSVALGGRYDGTLGVLAALEVINVLNDHGVATRHPIEVVNFTNEEGARFEPAMLGSGVLAGKFTPEWVYDRRDREGKRFLDELKRIGFLGSAANRPTRIQAYLELHLEQGPVLESESVPVGVVTGILGMQWMDVTLKGHQDHAGPSPMSTRRDAMVAAARCIVGVRDLARTYPDPIVATVGRIAATPGIVNVIPGEVRFSIDVRHDQSEGLADLGERARELVCRVAAEEGVSAQVELLWAIPPCHFDAAIVEKMSLGLEELGLPARRLTSGAGHDAKYMAELAPTGMIFVRTRDGKSHCEEEEAAWSDIDAAANLLLHTVERLA